MTSVLVLGASGMLGHKLVQTLGSRVEVWAAVRDQRLSPEAAAVLDAEKTVTAVRAEDPASIDRALQRSGAAVVVNAIGIIKQADAMQDPVAATRVNALFPHELASACSARGVRVIHVSTDCVFSGRRGYYSELDLPDPIDFYGRSKLVGELTEPGTLTLRTSIVGRELRGGLGLLEWFLGSRERRVKGFTRAVFSGLTTEAFAALIGDILVQNAELEGLWHVSSEPVDKFTLLNMLRDAFDKPIEIEPDDELVIDRSLDGSRLRTEIEWDPPSWEAMVAELTNDLTPYGAVGA